MKLPDTHAIATRATSPRAMLVLAPLILAGCEPRPAPPPAAPTPAVAIDSGRVAVAGGALYYEAAGKGAPVILLHGGNLDRRMWDEQFGELSQHYRVIRYDARGYGRSSAADQAFSAHEDLAGLMRGLNLVRASLVGLSLGGRIAIDFALAHPDQPVARLLAE